MLRNHLYYSAKPYLPSRMRLALRRWHAKRVLRHSGDVWPIMESAGRKPEGWPGWPDGKQFAFVLTHDVEGRRGLANARRLAELEMELGFRSCFNFVPEGEYTVPADLRHWLTDNGFEVGVHDLHHDGHLYRSRAAFRRHAARINHYLADWGAVGFRSGFMLHRLDWLHDLNIAYDSSTFDTDPFEPQPDGVHTIFPFWVPRPEVGDRSTQEADHITAGSTTENLQTTSLPPSSVVRPPSSVLRHVSSGYIELPYTLSQDSTLFCLFRDRSIGTWTRKLQWLAERRGMALLNVHPDYVALTARSSGFPVAYYRSFLLHVRESFSQAYWHALPREVAERCVSPNGVRKDQAESSHLLPTSLSPKGKAGGAPKIWIDLDNTPHVPFFRPIIRELEKRGFTVVLTARDAFQVCDLAQQAGLTYTQVGHHYGKSLLRKGFGLLWRSVQLLPFTLREKPDLAVSHGARSQLLIANLLRIPTVLILDYEHAQSPALCRPKWEIMPQAVPREEAKCNLANFLRYPGIKEDVYAPDLVPDPTILHELDIEPSDLIVTVRPPANEAHYHNPESDTLLIALMERLTTHPEVKAVLLPRNRRQGDTLRREWPGWFLNGKTVVPSRAVDGMNLLWFSDLVVSGGGTMNREAAALGVPVYSIFRGRIGGVDRQLQAEGRLTLISTPQEVNTKIRIQRRAKGVRPDTKPRPALDQIRNHLELILRHECTNGLCRP